MNQRALALAPARPVHGISEPDVLTAFDAPCFAIGKAEDMKGNAGYEFGRTSSIDIFASCSGWLRLTEITSVIKTMLRSSSIQKYI